jgi:hypothetical protein
MITTTERMQRKSLALPDEVRSFDKGKVELVTVNDVTFGRATLQPGWKWSTCVKPLAHTQSCEAAHLQYHIAGRLHVVMDDGTAQDFGPGDVSCIPPGHDAWVVGNDPVLLVDITGMRDYAKH